MPFTGGWTPQPERAGGGTNGTDKPLVQRIFESLSTQRGSAYTSNPQSVVGAETMAYARAIAFDAWGVNERLANSFIPSRMTAATGMLQRWERVFGTPPLPGDAETTRRTRIAGGWSAIGVPNSSQPITDALTAALGPIFVGIVRQNPGNATSYINGVSNVVATGTAPPIVTFTGPALDIFQIQANITTGGALGAAAFTFSFNGGLTFPGGPTTIPAAVPPSLTGDVLLSAGPVNTGITAHFSPGTYATDNVYKVTVNPAQLWTSTLSHIEVQLTPTPAGYHNPDGSPNEAFYNLAASIGSVLDGPLPTWCTYSWFIANSFAVMGFRLDERNLDLEAFGV